MSPDQKLIQCAYEDAVKNLYAKLFEGYTEAGGDAAQEQQAEQHFTTGIGHARRTRERAIPLLG